MASNLARAVVRHAFVLPLSVLLGLSASFLSGCGGGAGPPAIVTGGVYFQGSVRNGQQPIAGARVYLYAAGATGYGSDSTSLIDPAGDGATTDETGVGYVVTDGRGEFKIGADWPCATGMEQIYVLSQGDPTGVSSNAALSLMTALGPCKGLLSSYPDIVVNEATTVASVWALQQFLADATHLGSSSTNSVGLANAFAQVPNLVSPTTGIALAKTPGDNGTIPQGKINALANILSTCAISTTGASPGCINLFASATPPGQVPATDILIAAAYIAKDPGRSVVSLFGLINGNAPFQPTLNAAPNDWMLPTSFTGGGLNNPTSLGADAAGNLWVSNYAGVASLFSPTGEPLSATGYTGNGLHESFGMAIDIHNNIWFANQESTDGVNQNLGTVTKLDAGGQPSSDSPYVAGGLYFPISVTADPNGNMWIANYGNSTVTLLSELGVPLSGPDGWGGASLNFPVAVAVDSHHNAWVANQSANTITKISADGSTTTVIPCCEGASGVATDQRDNIWVANYYGDSISAVDSGDEVILKGVSGGGLLHPQGIAVDGAGTIWVANYRGKSISELSGTFSASPGTFLSPVTGFGTDASLLQPYGLAIDASGNLWVSNFGKDTITQFLGIATPVKTPLAGPPSLP